MFKKVKKMKKQYLSIAIALALSSTYAHAVIIQGQHINSDSTYEVEDLTVEWNGSVTAPSITVTNDLQVNGPGGDTGGIVTSNGDLAVGTLQTTDGSVIVKEKLTITGSNLTNFYGKVEAKELHFSQAAQLLNRGTIQIDSLVGDEVAITNNLGRGNQPGTEFVITNMPTAIGSLSNYSVFKVGSAGEVLKVTGGVTNISGTITSVDGQAIGLNVGGTFNNGSDLTLTELTVNGSLANNANLTVEGNTTVNTSLSVANGKTVTIKGNLDVSKTPYNYGGTHSLSNVDGNLIVLGDAKVASGTVTSTGGLSVGGTLTITGQMLEYFGESQKFKVDNIILDHQAGRMDTARLSLKSEGDYHLKSLAIKNSTGQKEKYNGIQLFNANLTVDDMTVGTNAVGMIHFYEGTKHEAKIGTLNVVETGTFHVASKNGTSVDGSLNNIVVDNATFANDTYVNRKEGFVGLTFKNLTAEGKLNIQDFGDKSTLNINNLHANGGAVTIDQPMQGAATVINIAEGASVAMNRGTTVDSLTVNMGTLAKNALVVDSVGSNTKTSLNIDGKLNNKEASAVLQELDSAVKLGKDDKGNFEYVIGEGDLFGAITGDSTGAYHQEKNEKLTGLGAVTALSALTLRHEMNSLSKRMGELRDAPAGVGAWVRSYGSEMEYGAQNVKAKNNSIQVGSDYTFGDWKVGAAFSYTDGESSYDKGSADNKGYGVALYGTWFVPCGAYVDLMAKYNRLDNDFALNGMNGSYDSSAYGVSAETGYRFNFMDGGVFVEPQVGLAYSRMTGENFVASNGVTVDQDDYDSFIGRVGVRTGFKFPKDKGTIYARVSGVYDFEGAMSAVASKAGQSTKFEEDLGGAWLEMGVGANFNWTKNTYTYVDFERTNGGDVKENYRWNIGVRHNF